MECKKCRCQMSGLIVEAPGVASMFCPSGHRLYLSRNSKGKWETQEQRQSRMAYRVKCQECGGKYCIPIEPALNHQPEKNVCPACTEKQYQSAMRLLCIKRKLANGHRKNALTPWRLGGSTLYR